ncbi:craniofacial development protein 2-like [Diorhabda sublineata]|uniref:craniofacial development protein 2-like n=1 Tax=Diorhabda sublineata TaxID=1163346 RepID=UPI0024E0A5AD|nr:craniofacial development protein 2-like [Diorhabda sublineata]
MARVWRFSEEKTALYYSGTETGQHRNGVGIIVRREMQQSVINFISYNDKIMLLQIKAHPVNVDLLQIYAPTSDHSDEEVEDFYADLENLTRNLKKHEIDIVMDDFNAKVGKRSVPGVAGDFGLGQRKERGDRLIEYCQEHDLIITNTIFKLHPRRLYTWTAPGDREGQVIRNQLDYILTNRRFRNATYGVKTYPSADAATDHNILIANVKIKLRSQKKTIQTTNTGRS